jgi:hypothetical protein
VGWALNYVVSLRLETGLGSDFSTWYQSWKVGKSRNISATENRDFSEKRGTSPGRKFFGLCFSCEGQWL